MIKKLLLVALIAVGLSPCVSAQWALEVSGTDSLIVDDTLEMRRDTFYTSSFELNGARYMNFAVGLDFDTSFADDTVWAQIQFSLDQILWATHGTDIQVIEFTSADADTTVNSTLIVDADASFMGAFARCRFITVDSSVGGVADSTILGNAYNQKYKLWYKLGW